MNAEIMRCNYCLHLPSSCNCPGRAFKVDAAYGFHTMRPDYACRVLGGAAELERKRPAWPWWIRLLLFLRLITPKVGA
jgi:hypothetical protein